MRDGRRVEIPNEFTVTDSTLTYYVGNGIQVTMQLNTVDIGATERANREARGAFMLRANAPKPNVERAPQARPARAQRSITNNDLEKFRRARLESDKEREELGLPSVEERQREVAEIEDRTAEQARNMREQEEAYWRGRADALRAEDEAQFGAFRQGPADLPWSSFGTFPGFFDTAGFAIAPDGFHRFRRFPASPFSGFLATPITPFPTFPVDPVFSRHGRPLVFRTPGVQVTRPMHMRHR